MVVAATKNKHLKIVTFLRIGVRNLSSIGKKKKKKTITFVYVLSLYLHNNTVFKRAVIMISILLLRKQMERS